MPDGKPAGVRCIHLTIESACAIFLHPDRPAVCASLEPRADMCRTTPREAYAMLASLERATR